MPKNELMSLLALSLMPGLGPVLFKRALEVHGSAEAALMAGPKKLAALSSQRKKLSVEWKSADVYVKAADREAAKAKKTGVRIIGRFDEDYPELLREIYDPPIVLYVKGKLPEPGYTGVGIVGSREASLYGLRMAAKLAGELAFSGAVVVSGLALGVDGAAHEGALKSGGVTLAVLGSGLNVVYPEQHKKMAREIEKSGALISEYPMDMLPLPQNFPLRNRVISGLSRGVVIVEARAKSGALITADAALEQNREVFALPGNADSERSAGTHGLLKQGARMVTSAADILEGLGAAVVAGRSKQAPPLPTLSEDEDRLLSHIETKPQYVDEIIEHSGVSHSRALSALTLLEIKKIVKQLPGKQFVRVR